MKAQDVQDYLQSLAGEWQYPVDTVDTFKAGDPHAVARGIAVGWMSYTWALQRALDLDCNVFITHEPTYYSHWDNDEDILRLAPVRAKKRFIEENGLVIIRCHDLWDQMTGMGIPDAWGQHLALGKAIDGDTYIRVYETGGQRAGDLARRVAGCTAAYGQPGVQLIGSEEKLVHRVSIGTGAITPYLECVERFAIDLAICTDDGMEYWRDGGFAIDMDIPIIAVNHMVSEEVGIERLSEQLRRRFPAIPVHHIRQRCMYRLVRDAQ
ncbi:MAG: Nif3-like dinuclear metal center hexameric protein [Chloroflexi bacterium]|nr:Nif3-like dinuclear metal center hexameric protein [Chloroflexota bacterium]